MVPQPRPWVEISPVTSTTTLIPGQSSTVRYRLIGWGGAELSVHTLPNGVTASFDQNPVRLVQNEPTFVTLTLTPAPDAFLSAATIEITAAAEADTAGAVIEVITPPVVSTTAATQVGQNTATLNGSVNPAGSQTSYHFEYGTTTGYGSTAPVPDNDAGSGSNPVDEVQAISGLQPATTYHFRLVATNPAGTALSPDATFPTTPAVVPVVSTAAATQVTQNSATLNGSVNPEGATSNGEFAYGTTTGYGSIAAAWPSVDPGFSPVSVSGAISGLQPATTYHFQLTEYNSAGYARGSDDTFRTLAQPRPVVSTTAATQVTQNSATLNGSVNPEGASTGYFFSYGTTTGYGSTAPGEDVGSGSSPVSVSRAISGLQPGTTYHFRLQASNSAGVALGSDATFTTSLPSPYGVSVIQVLNNYREERDIILWVFDNTLGEWQQIGTIPYQGTIDFTLADRHLYQLFAVDPVLCGENNPEDNTCVPWNTSGLPPTEGDPNGPSVPVTIE